MTSDDMSACRSPCAAQAWPTPPVGPIIDERSWLHKPVHSFSCIRLFRSCDRTTIGNKPWGLMLGDERAGKVRVILTLKLHDGLLPHPAPSLDVSRCFFCDR